MPRRTYRERIESYQRRHPGASVAEARGHRGPADAARAIRNADSVTTHISGRDAKGRIAELTVVVTGKDGLDRAFRIRRDSPQGKKAIKEADQRFARKVKGIRRAIKDSTADYQTYLRNGKPTGIEAIK